MAVWAVAELRKFCYVEKMMSPGSEFNVFTDSGQYNNPKRAERWIGWKN